MEKKRTLPKEGGEGGEQAVVPKSSARAKPAPEIKEEVSDEKLDEAIEELVAD